LGVGAQPAAVHITARKKHSQFLMFVQLRW